MYWTPEDDFALHSLVKCGVKDRELAEYLANGQRTVGAIKQRRLYLRKHPPQTVIKPRPPS